MDNKKTIVGWHTDSVNVSGWRIGCGTRASKSRAGYVKSTLPTGLSVHYAKKALPTGLNICDRKIAKVIIKNDCGSVEQLFYRAINHCFLYEMSVLSLTLDEASSSGKTWKEQARTYVYLTPYGSVEFIGEPDYVGLDWIREFVQYLEDDELLLFKEANVFLLSNFEPENYAQCEEIKSQCLSIRHSHEEACKLAWGAMPISRVERGINRKANWRLLKTQRELPWVNVEKIKKEAHSKR